MKEASLPRTYSFSEQQQQAHQASDKPATAAVQAEVTPAVNNQKADTSPPHSLHCDPKVDEAKPAEDKASGAAANPFLEQAQEKPDLTACQTTSCSGTPSMLAKAPDRPDHKAYTGSPNLQLRKRANPLARFLPKAFSVDINAYAPLEAKKTNKKDEDTKSMIKKESEKRMSEKRESSLKLGETKDSSSKGTEKKDVLNRVAAKREAGIKVTEKQFNNRPEEAKGKKNEKDILQSDEADPDNLTNANPELIIKEVPNEDGKPQKRISACCGSDVTAGKCECTIM